MSACRDCDESSLASEPGVSIRGSAIAAHGPQPEGVPDLRLAIGVALFAIGVACLVLGLGDRGMAASPHRAVSIVALSPDQRSAPALAPSGGGRGAALEGPVIPAARPGQGMDEFALAAARSSLLEMSARLRHTTLGADAATRATVAADFTYAYAWLRTTAATPEAPGTPASDGHATPTLAARAAKPAPRH
jgi:hypothetical protein